jgi:hypothetical protein
MSFMDIVWFIVITFAFMAYLMVLFTIIGDLFRDPEASGFEKALWMIALIFVPFLTALAYLIFRGKSMGDRQVRNMEKARDDQAAYIREVASQASPADQIVQAKQLLDAGTITSAEYDRLRAKALA